MVGTVSNDVHECIAIIMYVLIVRVICQMTLWTLKNKWRTESDKFLPAYFLHDFCIKIFERLFDFYPLARPTAMNTTPWPHGPPTASASGYAVPCKRLTENRVCVKCALRLCIRIIVYDKIVPWTYLYSQAVMATEHCAYLYFLGSFSNLEHFVKWNVPFLRIIG